MSRDTSTDRRLPGGIWAMGIGSLLMDTSSELIHSLTPVLLVGVLGASVATVGVIEGIAEATASLTKALSGTLSDRLRRRKTLMLIGYGLAALSKPLFPLAGSAGWVFAARFIDRIGKGIRGAPRDALVADIVPSSRRGAAYGLRQALDSAGAVIGPLLAVAFMAMLANDVRATLWIAIVPSVLAVAVLWIFVREPERSTPAGKKPPQPEPSPPLQLSDAKRLPLRFWLVILFGTVLALARFSGAFLVLRAESVGIALGLVPMVIVVMNVVYAGLAYPAGAASDRLGAQGVLLLGLLALIAADVVLALASNPLVIFAGAALWGLHLALTQGLLARLLADTAPANLRGTAFGVFGLTSGIAAIAASVLAGVLWSVYGPQATFIAGAAFAFLSAIGLTISMYWGSAAGRIGPPRR